MAEAKIDIYFLVFSSILLFFAFIFSLIYFFNYYRKKQRKNFLEKEALTIKFKEELLNTRLEIQEQTMKNISQEIHDNIGQVLSLAKLNLSTTDVNKTENAQQKVDQSKDLVAKAIQDLRDLSKSLNTDYVQDMGLPRSIEYELEIIKKTGTFETRFELSGIVYKIGQQKELILFRIVQELLNNIIKHTRAAQITVMLYYQPSLFSMMVEDDGEGFDVMELQKNKAGLGIKNMQNRAQLLGAEFIVSSVIGKGTTAQINLPIPK
ncbi:MAG TPA: ATP-binding protein [Puia sp.]|jgi:two-component system NarL family sensor kinase|nr:ATP-binding protein [Puia sp.]